MKDPLTAVAGALRVDLLRFVGLVSLGKTARYLFILGASIGGMARNDNSVLDLPIIGSSTDLILNKCRRP